MLGAKHCTNSIYSMLTVISQHKQYANVFDNMKK